MQAILALEDGRIFHGKGYGAKGECYGEVVFNTSITGYQEIFTDPSYAGQIVVLTNPEIGNYGTNSDDNCGTRHRANGANCWGWIASPKCVRCARARQEAADVTPRLQPSDGAADRRTGE